MGLYGIEPRKDFDPNYKKPNKGGKIGNPAFGTSADKNSFAVKPENRSPGGEIHARNKFVRAALTKLLLQAPSDNWVPKTRAEELAFALWTLAKGDSPQALGAIKEIADRIDGRTPLAESDAEALAASGAKVVLIDSRMLPPVLDDDTEGE
jgi:hypothetical protein